MVKGKVKRHTSKLNKNLRPKTKQAKHRRNISKTAKRFSRYNPKSKKYKRVILGERSNKPLAIKLANKYKKNGYKNVTVRQTTFSKNSACSYTIFANKK